jgi:hypothetical protein
VNQTKKVRALLFRFGSLTPSARLLHGTANRIIASHPQITSIIITTTTTTTIVNPNTRIHTAQ